MNYWCKNTQCVLHTGVSSLIHIEFNIVELTTLFIKLFSKLLYMIKSSMIHLNDFNEVHNQNQTQYVCSMVNQWLITIDYIQWIDYSFKIYHNDMLQTYSGQMHQSYINNLLTIRNAHTLLMSSYLSSNALWIKPFFCCFCCLKKWVIMTNFTNLTKLNSSKYLQVKISLSGCVHR